LTRERDAARAEVERVRAAAPAPAEHANGDAAEAADEQPAKRVRTGVLLRDGGLPGRTPGRPH